MWPELLGTLLLLCVAPETTNSLNSSFGPWVESTSGEVWPRPSVKEVKEDFYILRASNFQIRASTNADCDVLVDAIQRYSGIILTESRIARLVTEGQTTESVRASPHFKGTLQELLIQMSEPCNATQNLQPRLRENEKYTLNITESSTTAQLVAENVWGILRGLETFSQLLTPSGEGSTLQVNCQFIYDEPKFPHRGLLLDTSRHYLPLRDIFLTLDAMSYNKMNVLHWHIVDDNSFPYQSVTYPNLSSKGAFHFSMIYTQDDVQRVINYARLRGIRVVPEFDTPGHTRSWGEAYPELLTVCYDADGNPNGILGPMNPTNPQLYEFMRNLLAEVVQVFPDKYIHLGGDEVPFDCWASNPEILAYMDSHNMSRNFVALEGEYIAKLIDITAQLNGNPIVWQEVFDQGIPIARNTVVHVWTGRWQKELQRATAAGYPVLLSACWYLDHLATGGDWKKYYNCDPLSFIGAANVTNLVLGGEACMWGEFVDRNNIHSRIWPRASATAERLWSTKAQSIDKAAQRLEEHTCRMNRRGIPAQPPNGPGFCVV